MAELKSRKKKKNPGGRPLKYKKDFHPDEFVRLSIAGKSRTQIAAAWGLSRDTINDWESKYKEFSNATKKGKAALEDWYTNLGLLMATGKMPKGNVTAYIWLTKNITDWSDKKEIKHDMTDFEFED